MNGKICLLLTLLSCFAFHEWSLAANPGRASFCRATLSEEIVYSFEVSKIHNTSLFERLFGTDAKRLFAFEVSEDFSLGFAIGNQKFVQEDGSLIDSGIGGSFRKYYLNVKSQDGFQATLILSTDAPAMLTAGSRGSLYWQSSDNGANNPVLLANLELNLNP